VRNWVWDPACSLIYTRADIYNMSSFNTPTVFWLFLESLDAMAGRGDVYHAGLWKPSVRLSALWARISKRNSLQSLENVKARQTQMLHTVDGRIGLL
jgi:hypothetical protein